MLARHRLLRAGLGLYALTWSITRTLPESPFYGYNVPAVVATARRKSNLVKSRLTIGSGYYFLPLVRRNLKGDIWIIAKYFDYFKPRNSNSLDQSSLSRLTAGHNDSLKQQISCRSD